MRSWMICTTLALLSSIGCSQDRTVELPRGTQLAVSLENGARSDRSHPGDEIVAVTIEPIHLRSRIVVPAGTRVHGVVTSATPAGSGDPATLAIEFRHLESQGTHLAIVTHPIRLVSRNADAVEAGAAPAAVVDADPGGQAAVVGGGVEPHEAALTRGDDIALHPGQRILFRLDNPLRVNVAV